MDNIQEIIEENFCLKFELDSLADHLLFGKHERWVHGFMNKYGEELHLKRYEFAKKYVNDKSVLDIAGGCGYGTYILAQDQNPTSVTSLDLDKESVRYAQHRYPHERITRKIGNAQDFQFENQFELIVSFETIEHLPQFTDFLACIHKSLADNGRFIVSTPVVDKTSTENINSYHVIEWSLTDFKILLEKSFHVEEILVQNIVQKSSVVDTFWKRLNHKFNPSKSHQFDPELRPLPRDFNEKEVHSGFQIYICSKK